MPDNTYAEAILFDLDDTIITGDVGTDELWKTLCYQYADLIEGLQGETLYSEISKTRDWYWADPERHRIKRLNLVKARRELVELVFSKLGIENEEVCYSLADSFTVKKQEMVTLIPGSLDTLVHFRNTGVPMALITNGASDFQRQKIDRFDLTQYFDYILVEGEFGAGKPDISVFIHALAKLGVSTDKAWMVGDDLKRDILGANQAGIFSIWVDWQNKGLPGDSPAHPDRTVSNIAELV